MRFFLFSELTGRSGHQTSDHRGSSDRTARAPLRRALRSQSSRVLCKEQGLQAAFPMDHGHHEPLGRVTSRT